MCAEILRKRKLPHPLRRNSSSMFDRAHDSIQEMTLHVSKGLEFPVVALVGAGRAIHRGRLRFSRGLQAHLGEEGIGGGQRSGPQACHTPNPAARRSMPISISRCCASAYDIGLNPSYRSGRSRRPYFVT
jgi:superfamily I DNA/RNA helicase